MSSQSVFWWIQKQDSSKKEEKPNQFKILHLSDLHITVESRPIDMLQPLLSDLKRGYDDNFSFNKIDYIVISGDITAYGKKEEFTVAKKFIELLLHDLEISAEMCIIVPGNHDMDWEGVYEFKKVEELNEKERSIHPYFEKRQCYGIRNEKKYQLRFANFKEFYKDITKLEYPDNVEQETIAFPVDSFGIQFLAFNSCWEIDERNQSKASINNSALSNCLYEIAKEVTKPVFRIAVMHHPVMGNDNIEENGICLERLLRENVRILLHGHVHEERSDIFCRRDKEKSMHIVGTGTFGAISKDRPESTPCLYSVIQVEKHKKIKVHVRCKEKKNGFWEGWYKWPVINGGKESYYEDDL